MIDFEKTLTLLSDAGVQFVIIGGLAITIHGSAYITFASTFATRETTKT